MAKHPHRLMLFDGRTWKCTLDGCAFFVHLGLAHVLMGKRAICWECGEIFTIDEYALRDNQPKCIECRSGGGDISVEQKNDIIEWRMAQALKAKSTPVVETKPELESVKDHSPDCASWANQSCDCGAE